LVIISFISRTVLLGMSVSEVNTGIFSLLRVYFIDLFFDAVAFSYFMIPFVIFLMLVPDRFFNSGFHKWFAYIAYFIAFAILLFNGVSEYFFWEEFGVRYNFIAVDYLVYTTEVLTNIWESYPVPLLISTILLVDLAIMFLIIKKKWLIETLQSKSGLRYRMFIGTVLLTFPILSFLIVSFSWAEKTQNRYNNELSKNGIYSLFAAFINNELDYETFYISHNNDQNFKHLRKLIKTDNSEFQSNEPTNITRLVTNGVEEKKYNVLFITMESLSGEFMEYLGSKKGKITPNLDTLVNKSLLFTNFYAVGTRTIWGLEAAALSAPPKPGQSVIKRPNSENMFSMGQLFKKRGYDLKFIYGGYGYFDNMNYFFENNGYNIVDRTVIADNEVTFANAWGVCDQDLFNRVLREGDLSYTAGKPFTNLIMTTSNHRPFTYPEGVIDIPSGTGREGAVKYCDFAIGEFIRKASTKPWFSNTLIVIMADHCAGSAGQTELPFMEYKIPLIIYNPAIVQPQRSDKLSSQIDVAPTLLALLNWNYESKFFGKDILKMKPEDERAFIANYQKLGYIKNDRLTILSPQQKATSYKIDRFTGKINSEPIDEESLNEAVTYYQSASYVQKNHLNKWDKK
ncbi:MAG: sulfatase-like hydrolase/transferase, partial [Bacteroidia bacterium]|nr:sulfatase-like hydrolase/transferase [Bacteroidia bacterium]